MNPPELFFEKSLTKQGKEARFYRTDVSSEFEAQKTIDKIIAAFTKSSFHRIDEICYNNVVNVLLNSTLPDFTVNP